jgi:hypothetical protein
MGGQLKGHSSGRLPPSLVASTQVIRGQKPQIHPSLRVGGLDIQAENIAAMTLHRTPLFKGIGDNVKRGYNRIL